MGLSDLKCIHINYENFASDDQEQTGHVHKHEKLMKMANMKMFTFLEGRSLCLVIVLEQVFQYHGDVPGESFAKAVLSLGPAFLPEHQSAVAAMVPYLNGNLQEGKVGQDPFVLYCQSGSWRRVSGHIFGDERCLGQIEGIPLLRPLRTT